VCYIAVRQSIFGVFHCLTASTILVTVEAEELKIIELLISNKLMSTMISELSWK